jgi:phenylacetate-CoA ligase
MEEPKHILKMYQEKPEEFWLDLRKKNLIQVFKRTVKNVPAYKNFLKLNRVELAKVNTLGDFENLPSINKRNYFHVNSFDKIIESGSLENNSMVLTSTSGSTGQPTYFPRLEALDLQYSVLAEFFVNNGPKGSTLFVDCFGMGVWIGGLISYQAFRYMSLRGYPVTIITPGVNKKEIFHCLKQMAPNFDNVIIAGYPPFIKDVIDEAPLEGINFKKFKTRLLFAAESFTEKFRDYLARAVKIKDVHHDTLNIYGSAELGAMAFETPTTIFIRRLAIKHPRIYMNLFNTDKTATLAQYNPMFVNFEAMNGRVLITAESASPFVRYEIGDNGGVLSINEIKSKFKDSGIDLDREIKKAGIKITNLPFVYVYERTDLSTKLYGAIIYPEPIRNGLQDPKLYKYVTGKFTMITKFDKKENEFLEINVELKVGVKSSNHIKKLCEDLILNHLLKKNAEYKNNYSSIPHKVKPRIVLWPNSDPVHFTVGAKQKWVKVLTA